MLGKDVKAMGVHRRAALTTQVRFSVQTRRARVKVRLIVAEKLARKHRYALRFSASQTAFSLAQNL